MNSSKEKLYPPLDIYQYYYFFYTLALQVDASCCTTAVSVERLHILVILRLIYWPSCKYSE